MLLQKCCLSFTEPLLLLPVLKVTYHLSYLKLSSFLLPQHTGPKPPPGPQTWQTEQPPSHSRDLAASNNILLLLPCKGCPGELSHSSPLQINFWWQKSVFHLELWLGNSDVQLAAARRQEKRVWEKEIPGTSSGSEELQGRITNKGWGTAKTYLQSSSRSTCQTILPPNLRLAGAASHPATCLQDAQGPLSPTKAALSSQDAA